MGKLFSWTQFINSVTKNEKHKKQCPKRTLKQVKECLILDQLFWSQKSKKPLPDSLEKLDKNWYCQVMKGAKYSQIGHSFIDPKQNIKCVIIERPCMDTCENLYKPCLSMKRQSIKHELRIKSKSAINEINPISPLSNTVYHSPSGSISGDSSSLSVSKIVQQPQKIIPKLETSHSVTLYQTSKENLDILNYDFSFTSPLVKS